MLVYRDERKLDHSPSFYFIIIIISICSIPITLVSTSNFEVEAKVHIHHMNFHLVEMNFELFLMKYKPSILGDRASEIVQSSSPPNESSYGGDELLPPFRNSKWRQGYLVYQQI